MKRLNKVVSILLVYCFILVAIPTDVLAQTIKATKNTVPKYLDYSEAYVETGMQYKDKTFLLTSKGSKYFSNGKASTINNIFPWNQISDKQFFDKSSNNIFDLETGKISSLDENTIYTKEKNLVISKYKGSNLEYKEMAPIKSTGEVKWSLYRVVSREGSLKGAVNSNLKTYEFSLDTEYSDLKYSSYVYKDSLYYINIKNELIVINADGSSHKYAFNNDVKKAYTNVCPRVYVNKNGIYFKFDKYKANGFNTFLQKVKISNNQVALVSNRVINIFPQEYNSNSMSIDINYNIWTVKDGFVYKLENDSLVKKYQVDKKMNSIYVYDDKHLTVSGFDATTRKGRYKIINIK